MEPQGAESRHYWLPSSAYRVGGGTFGASRIEGRSLRPSLRVDRVGRRVARPLLVLMVSLVPRMAASTA